MILKTLKIFSQNVFKNKLLTDTLLENNKEFYILFIQKPSWSIIYNISSTISKEDEEIVSAPNHLSWTIFIRTLNTENKYLRVLTYINIRILWPYFSLIIKDIFNHRGALYHSSQTLFTRTPNTMNKHPRVLAYINSKLIRLYFLLRRDILNYRNINLLFFSIVAIYTFLLISIQITINLL